MNSQKATWGSKASGSSHLSLSNRSWRLEWCCPSSRPVLYDSSPTQSRSSLFLRGLQRRRLVAHLHLQEEEFVERLSYLLSTILISLLDKSRRSPYQFKLRRALPFRMELRYQARLARVKRVRGLLPPLILLRP